MRGEKRETARGCVSAPSWAKMAMIGDVVNWQRRGAGWRRVELSSNAKRAERASVIVTARARCGGDMGLLLLAMRLKFARHVAWQCATRDNGAGQGVGMRRAGLGLGRAAATVFGERPLLSSTLNQQATTIVQYTNVRLFVHAYHLLHTRQNRLLSHVHTQESRPPKSWLLGLVNTALRWQNARRRRPKARNDARALWLCKLDQV